MSNRRVIELATHEWVVRFNDRRAVRIFRDETVNFVSGEKIGGQDMLRKEIQHTGFVAVKSVDWPVTSVLNITYEGHTITSVVEIEDVGGRWEYVGEN